MRRLKVLYATHEPNLTGASRSLLDLLAALDRDVVEPVVLVRRQGPLLAELDGLDVPHKLLPYVNATEARTRVKTAAKRPIVAVQDRWIARYIRREGFDLVHNNSFIFHSAMRAARSAGVPYACHLREYIEEDHNLAFLNASSAKKLLSDAACNVAISTSILRKFQAWAPDARFELVPDGLRVESYLHEHGPVCTGAPVRLLLAGQICPGKGQLEAVQATELLVGDGMDAHLTIVGGVRDDAYSAELHGYVAERGLEKVVSIKPFAQDLTEEYARADIALMCSPHEALGRATIEGMLHGCAVIGANAGATPELIGDDERGYLYECGNPADLAMRIAWAATHPDEMNATRLCAQRWAVEVFDVKAYSRKMAELYRSVLNCPRSERVRQGITEV